MQTYPSNDQVAEQPTEQPMAVEQASQPETSSVQKRRFVLGFIGILFIVGAVVVWQVSQSKPAMQSTDSSQQAAMDQSTTDLMAPSEQAEADLPKIASGRQGLFFDRVIKSVAAETIDQLGMATKSIPLQIFAYNDSNGNGVREAGEAGLGFMDVQVYDSAFATEPLKSLTSTDTGWASALIDTASNQLVVSPVASSEYYPTSKSVVVSKQNNFATFGFQKQTEVAFHVSVFAFQDTNGDGNYNYDDPSEKPLFLAPFTFYQQTTAGTWEKLPNSVNTTDTGWGTTTLSLKYPYLLKVEAGAVEKLVPVNTSVETKENNLTLIFPYQSAE